MHIPSEPAPLQNLILIGAEAGELHGSVIFNPHLKTSTKSIVFSSLLTLAFNDLAEIEETTPLT